MIPQQPFLDLKPRVGPISFHPLSWVKMLCMQHTAGVVPEIAARAHSERIDLCVEQAVKLPGLQLKDVDVIAATSGPGLIGGVLSAVMCAKGLAKGLGKPLIGVNHLAGHALTPRLTDHIAFPYLMLLVSGGHCQFLAVKGPNDFSRIGGTIDDAPGEAFDKVARLLGLPQPGGPSVEQWARQAIQTVLNFRVPCWIDPAVICLFRD